MPDIGSEDNSHILLSKTPPARVVLSFECGTFSPDYPPQYVILGAVMAILPLDGLVTLTALCLPLPTPNFWLRHFSKWRQLQRFRLILHGVLTFTQSLGQDEGGRENPLLPSLKELILLDSFLYEKQILALCDVLMKRVEQGVPLRRSTCAHAAWLVIIPQQFSHSVTLWPTLRFLKKKEE